MAELATIARPYAEALFKAVTQSGSTNLDQTAGWVDELAAIAGDARLSSSPPIRRLPRSRCST